MKEPSRLIASCFPENVLRSTGKEYDGGKQSMVEGESRTGGGTENRKNLCDKDKDESKDGKRKGKM